MPDTTAYEMLREKRIAQIAKDLQEIEAELKSKPPSEYYKLGWLPHNVQYEIKLYNSKAQEEQFNKLIETYKLDKSYFNLN